MKDFSMELIWTKVQMAAAMIGGWLGYFLGGLDGLMIALIIFMVLDYITGLMCAVIDKKLSSAVGFRGICKKVSVGCEAAAHSTCKHCGRPLQQTPGKRRREFCGSACRAAYWRAHPKRLQFQRCAGCGTLLPMGSVSRKYCSHACYIRRRFGRENHA